MPEMSWLPTQTKRAPALPDGGSRRVPRQSGTDTPVNLVDTDRLDEVAKLQETYLPQSSKDLSNPHGKVILKLKTSREISGHVGPFRHAETGRTSVTHYMLVR